MVLQRRSVNEDFIEVSRLGQSDYFGKCAGFILFLWKLTLVSINQASNNSRVNCLKYTVHAPVPS